MTGAKRDPGTSANFRYTTSTDMTARLSPSRLINDVTYDVGRTPRGSYPATVNH